MLLACYNSPQCYFWTHKDRSCWLKADLSAANTIEEASSSVTTGTRQCGINTGNTIVDQSGNGNSPNITDTGRVTRVPVGESNNMALRLERGHEAVRLDALSGFDHTEAFSVTFWFARGSRNCCGERAIVGPGVWNELMIKYDWGDGFIGGIHQPITKKSSSGMIDAGTWMHVAVTFEDGYLRYYKNGQMDGGKIDDVRVHNRRLHTSEIRDIIGLPQDKTPYYLAEERYIEHNNIWSTTDTGYSYLSKGTISHFRGAMYCLILRERKGKRRPTMVKIQVDDKWNAIHVEEAFVEHFGNSSQYAEDYWSKPDDHHEWTMDVDKNGYIHVAGDMHNFPKVLIPLIPLCRYSAHKKAGYGLTRPQRFWGENGATIMYWRSTHPEDIHRMKFMGNDPSRRPAGYGYTYTSFFKSVDGTLHYGGRFDIWSNPKDTPQKRCQKSAGLTRYDTETQSWVALGVKPNPCHSYSDHGTICYSPATADAVAYSYYCPSGHYTIYRPRVTSGPTNPHEIHFVANVLEPRGFFASPFPNNPCGQTFSSETIYMKSTDGGLSWTNYTGQLIAMPANQTAGPHQADVVWRANMDTVMGGTQPLVSIDYRGQPLVQSPGIGLCGHKDGNKKHWYRWYNKDTGEWRAVSGFAMNDKDGVLGTTSRSWIPPGSGMSRETREAHVSKIGYLAKPYHLISGNLLGATMVDGRYTVRMVEVSWMKEKARKTYMY
ncbi:unnamed protein product [Vitrella brassicaformis CCMP3155]|uniref:Uncharacterized protein n=1 Tax=Vitrella brassicaformis (strain CCMP3155) TaxID=1169540 RepID=A0A0G4E8G9_VITBC|nr:unnamed protein product [Vitrella brassicaformis CCMP3155]|eukprot:CEL92049.1 unnamed protein product [Vitrella brassicaformis CCMP3155]